MQNINSLLAFLVGLLLSVSLLVPYSHAETCSENVPFCTGYSNGSTCRAYTGAFESSETIDVKLGAYVSYSAYDQGCGTPYDNTVYVMNGQLYVMTDRNLEACSADQVSYHRVKYSTSAPECPLPPVEPSSCTNGSLDSGEIGIDCGGDCIDSCDSTICLNADAVFVDGVCQQQTKPDLFGNCPDGLTLSFEGDYCGGDVTPPIQYYSGDLVTTPDQDFDYEPEPDIEHFTKGSFSVVASAPTITSSVDNGDGTSTVTTSQETTTTDQNGSSTVTTTTNNFDIDNGTGETISGSESQTIQAETPVEENPDNYNTSFDYGDVSIFDPDITNDLPDEVTFSSVIDGFIASYPLFSVLDDQTISFSNTSCETEMIDVFGVSLNFSLCRFEDFLRSIGALFVVVAQAMAVFVVVRGWKEV